MVVASSIHSLANWTAVEDHYCIVPVTIDLPVDVPIRLGTPIVVHCYCLLGSFVVEAHGEDLVAWRLDVLLAWEEEGLDHSQVDIQHDPVSLKELLVVHTLVVVVQDELHRVVAKEAFAMEDSNTVRVACTCKKIADPWKIEAPSTERPVHTVVVGIFHAVVAGHRDTHQVA